MTDRDLIQEFNRKYPGDNPETIEQRYFVQWFRKTYPKVRIFAIPNGGDRNIAVASNLKLEGVLPGVPDLFIPKWNLWIEMKKKNGGVLSEHQQDWRQYLMTECQHDHIVGHGFEHAAEEVKSYVSFSGIHPEY